MIEAGQANPAQNHAGMYPCDGGSGAQGIIAGAAKAVSVASQTAGPQGMPPGGPALAGIIEGAKKNVAAINRVLATLRIFIGRPCTVLVELLLRRRPSKPVQQAAGPRFRICQLPVVTEVGDGTGKDD
jgi:hypothetical protein